MLAVGAEVQARGSAGTRAIAVEDLLLDPLTTSLEPNEVIEEIRVPDPGPRAGGTYLKLERRVGDFATVGVAVHLSFDDGRVRRAGIALTGVAPINRRARQRSRRWRAPSSPTRRSARRRAWPPRRPEPHDDIRGTAAYKRNVVRVFAERGLRAAATGASGPAQTADESFAGHETVEGVMDELREKQGVSAHAIAVTVNGAERTADVESRLLLVHLLREKLGLTGTHIGCDTSSCGACTVLLDGTPVKSCTMFAVQADGRSITTVEGLRRDGEAHPIQQGFREEHGLQCGFCTPGMMLSAVARGPRSAFAPDRSAGRAARRVADGHARARPRSPASGSGSARVMRASSPDATSPPAHSARIAPPGSGTNALAHGEGTASTRRVRRSWRTSGWPVGKRQSGAPRARYAAPPRSAGDDAEARGPGAAHLRSVRRGSRSAAPWRHAGLGCRCASAVCRSARAAARACR